MVPCSRSRIRAAPVRMTERMVMFLITCMTEVNHSDWEFGLNFAVITTLMGRTLCPSFALREAQNLPYDDVLQIEGAIASLSHRSRVNIDLDRRRSRCQQIYLEVRWDVYHEDEPAAVHRRNDVRGRHIDRRAEQRWRDGGTDQAGHLRAIFVDNADRCFRHLQLGTRRHRVDGNSECVDDE